MDYLLGNQKSFWSIYKGIICKIWLPLNQNKRCISTPAIMGEVLNAPCKFQRKRWFLVRNSQSSCPLAPTLFYYEKIYCPRKNLLYPKKSSLGSSKVWNLGYQLNSSSKTQQLETSEVLNLIFHRTFLGKSKLSEYNIYI